MQEEDGHVGSGLFATQVSLNMLVACYCRLELHDCETHGSHKYNDSCSLYDVLLWAAICESHSPYFTANIISSCSEYVGVME